ncbi:hypothetical protein [Phaeovulum sp. W22_SRMD_FR3]|uniref:hypothetical protein n=1 Tax=Phaeovulum sp. W22_SRMD_FR3 TaxID=3240274 RepID=UPI003F983B92
MSFRNIRGLALALGFACLSGGIAQADPAARAEMAARAGSERLRLFSLGKLLDTGAAPRGAVVQMKQDLMRQGYYTDAPQGGLIAAQGWANGLFGYDGNINGGSLHDRFNFGGLVFETDPAYRAKAGVVVGLTAGGLARYAWDNGRYLEARAEAALAWSPQHQIAHSSIDYSLCTRNHLTGWQFFDLCQSGTAEERDLGSRHSAQTSAALSQIFATATANHEIGAALASARGESGRQTSLTLSWAAVWDRSVTRLSLTKAAPIDDEIALNYRVNAGVQWLWHQRLIGVTLWHQRAAGGRFLGMPRADRAQGIDLSYEVNPLLTVQLGAMRNRSTASFFSYDDVSLSVHYDAKRW